MNTIFGKIGFFSLIVLGLINPLFGQAPEGEGALPGEEEVFSPEVDEPPPPSAPAALPSAPRATSAGAPPGAGVPNVVPPMEAAAPSPATTETTPPAGGEEEMVYLNVNDQDIKEVIKQISKATSRNFIIDAKVTGKVTILSNRMMTKAEAYQAFLSALEVAGFTTYSGPGGIIKIIPLRDAKNYPIPTHIDTTPYTDSYVTRLIKLENISADDMAEAIKGLISRNGNLFAYSETNTLVITDSGTNIDRLMKIIKELDQEGPQEVVEIIPIHFASAKELSGIVLSLYEQQAKGGGRRGEGGGAGEMAQVSKIIADERTNAIIVLASKRAIDKVKELINKLDAKLEEGQEGKIHVHYLRYAKAKDLVTVLQGLAGQAAKPPGQGGASQGAVIAELEDFKIASDDGTNSLLITATPKTYTTLVAKVIDKLDIPRKQVYLEAMVIEFFLSRKKELGITGHGGVAGGSMVGFGSTFKQLVGLFDPFAAGAGSAFINSPGLLGGILARRTVDLRVTATDGTTKVVTIPAFSAFLTALNTFGDTNLVASPNLLALDNEEASIEIIRKEPEPGQNVLSATGALQVGKPERIEAGLRLKLTPQVTERGTVRMKIDQQFSSFSTAKNPALGTQAIVERKVSTSVVTNDGQTVVIGGLMEDQQTIEKKKLPILGDIPLLGFLFQQRVTDRSKSNLLLFITPHIIRDSSDFDKVLRRKIGEQKEFIDKNYKPNQRKKVVGIIEEHQKGFFDILNEATQISQEAQSSEVSTTHPSSAPVITASPDQESRVTIILPPSSEEIPPSSAEEPKKKKKKQAAVLQPAPQPLAAPPPPPAKQEALASPPPPQVSPTPSSSGHAPVITLPPGSTPDLEE